jgi:hypothetical protein
LRVHLHSHPAPISATQPTDLLLTDIRATRNRAMDILATRDTPLTPVLRAMDTQVIRVGPVPPVLRAMDTQATRDPPPTPGLRDMDTSSLSDWSLADRGMERRFALRKPATGCSMGWRRGQRFRHEPGLPLWLKRKRHMRSYRVVRAKIRFMFQAMVTRLHSPRTLLSPRSRNCRKPRTDLMMPNTGSGVCLRRP